MRTVAPRSLLAAGLLALVCCRPAIAGDPIEMAAAAQLAQIVRTVHPEGARLTQREYVSPLDVLEELDDLTCTIERPYRDGDPAWPALPAVASVPPADIEDSAFRWHGLLATMRGGAIIIGTVEGLAGERAGLKPYDKVIEVNGRSIVAQKSRVVCGWITGCLASHLHLKVLRPGETAPREFHLEQPQQRVERPLPSVRRLEGGRIWIRIPAFEPRSADTLGAALEQVRAQGPVTGVIVDLRCCPGGFLNCVVDVGRLLVPRKGVMFQAAFADRTEPYAQEIDSPQLPTVVLIDGATVGSGEVTALMLREVLGAPLVGSRTVGRCGVFSMYPLSDGSHIKLRTGKLLTSRGVEVPPIGLTPDVEAPAGDRLSGDPARDPQLAAALAKLAH